MKPSPRDLRPPAANGPHYDKILFQFLQEKQKSGRLGDSMKALDDEMKRTDNLLYQMIPKSVAERLRKGEPAMNTCQVRGRHGPLARYVKLRFAHARGMPGTFSPPPRVSDPDMRHGTCVTHVSWCMPGSLTSGFFWSRWRGKRPRHSRRMSNSRFYVSGKTPMDK